mmetsp:Transcript_27640/g.50024  ORF Transcript_27640/g.50024 Transcript_27640/m.50024 type:complete len:249 (-) Transcript_27640:27-773(-)
MISLSLRLHRKLRVVSPFACLSILSIQKNIFSMARVHTTAQKARYAQKAKAKRLAEKESATKKTREKTADARRQRELYHRMKAQGKVPRRAKAVSFIEDKTAKPLLFRDVDSVIAKLAPANIAPTPTLANVDSLPATPVAPPLPATPISLQLPQTPAMVDSLPAKPIGHRVTIDHSKTAPSRPQRNGMTSQQRFELSIAKVNAIRDMRISAISELSAIRSELGALRKATLENANRGIQDVVGVQEEEE